MIILLEERVNSSILTKPKHFIKEGEFVGRILLLLKSKRNIAYHWIEKFIVFWLVYWKSIVKCKSCANIAFLASSSFGTLFAYNKTKQKA